ncbi:MAG: hypothetical protein R3F59_33530 [Myxococcota bacterium]
MRDWSVKHLLVAAFTLVVGLVIGGLGPRSEVRALRDEVADLRAKPCRAAGPDMRELFRGRTWEERPATPQAAPPNPPPPPRRPTRATTPRPSWCPAPEPVPVDDLPADERPPDGPDTEKIKDALQIRRAQALAALRERAGASDEQMDDVEAIVDRMNADLGAVAENWAAAMGEGDLSRREMMLMASDTLDVLIDTEDALYGTFGPDQRAALSDDVLDPTAYVDGSVVDRFDELR